MSGAADTLVPNSVSSGPFVRGYFALEHVGAIFGVALLPCIAMAVYNTGLQANRVIAAGGAPLEDGRAAVLTWVGAGFDPGSSIDCALFGALYFVPLAFVCAAGAWFVETLNAHLRERPASCTWPLFGVLLALTLPPTTPLGQALLATGFGTLFGQEIFGGPGMSFLNPVLLGRAFIFFAYPGGMSGDAPWIAASLAGVDAISGATPLSRVLLRPESFFDITWMDAFVGTIPGSMGETSVIGCIAGAVVLLSSRIVSWRIIAGVVVGTFATVLFFNRVGTGDNAMFALPFHWHVVTGSWAFGTVFFATDPSSAPFSNVGRLLYGAGIGALTIIIRVANPAYAEGMMLAILFMNVFAPLINYVSVELPVRRRGPGAEV